MARDAFRDAFAVERVDDRQDASEARFALLGMVEDRLVVVSYTLRGRGSPSSQPGTPNRMTDADTTMKTAKHDWSRADAMTDAEVYATALKDPDARPMTDEEFARAKRVPRARTLRRALGLTQEEFATRYQIPLGTLRDWEQGRAEPDQPARAYLKAIAGDPDAVHRALQAATTAQPR